MLPVFDCATNSVAQRIAGADPVVSLSRFAEYPPSKGRLGFPRCLWEKPFPANDKFWLKGVDFSCASPWTDDSGNPAFLLVGNEPILLYCLYSGGVGHGPAIHLYAKEVQKAMDELCPSYKLESFDFSKALH